MEPLPPIKAVPIEAKLVNKTHLTEDVIELHFQSEPAFNFYPGQYVSIAIPGAGPGGRDLRRAYSIASQPELGHLELCVKIVEGGPGTSYLNSLKIGESFKGNAPFGHFIYKTAPHKHVVMIATGTGIAPFRSMVLSDLYKKNPPLSTRLLFGARDKNDLLYGHTFANELKPETFIQTLSRCSDEWSGFKGRVTDWIYQNQESIDWANTEFYLCGNGAMIDEMKQFFMEKGVEKPSIHQEAYYKPKPGEVHASQD